MPQSVSMPILKVSYGNFANIGELVVQVFCAGRRKKPKVRPKNTSSARREGVDSTGTSAWAGVCAMVMYEN
jgi:hypothetical protein